VQISLGKTQDPISILTRAKWTRGVVQAEECPLHKMEAVSSNPSPNNNRIANITATCFGIWEDEERQTPACLVIPLPWHS
jgi:hypothetical protein